MTKIDFVISLINLTTAIICFCGVVRVVTATAKGTFGFTAKAKGTVIHPPGETGKTK